MIDNVAPPEPQKVKTHGVLYLHGAGMPPDDKEVIGDPLSTIANGLLDTFNTDPLLCRRYELVIKAKPSKATTSERNLAGLDFNVFCRSENGARGERECTIRMRNVMWKPTMRKRSLLDYIPLLWLWAFTFQSHAARIEELETRDRHQPADWDKDGLGPIEAESDSKLRRRLRDFRARLALADFGLVATILITHFLDKIAALTPPDWIASLISVGLLNLFKLGGPIATFALYISILTGIMLAVLAAKEFHDRNRDRLHGTAHIVAIMLTTAWLALFSTPFLLFLYYLGKIVKLALVLLVAAATFQIAISVDPSQVPSPVIALGINPSWTAPVTVALLVGVMLVRLFLLLLPALVVLAFSSQALARLQARVVLGLKNMLRSKRAHPLIYESWRSLQTFIMGCLTALFVSAGAPVVIVLIVILDLLSVLPFVGDSLKKLAKSISEAGLWESLKDIHMFLTDSSRAAVARCCIEKALVDLGQEEGVESIHVLAHSLGTVVAYETLAQIGRGDGVLIQKGGPTYSKIKTLVTFGSPLNKIRTLANITARERQVMTDFDCTRFNDAVVLEGFRDLQWLNFYSLHDVTSDVLSLYARETDPIRPQEFSVPSANDIVTAHGAYWTDPGFWNTSLQALGIIYPEQEMTRIEKLLKTPKEAQLLDSFRGQGILTRGQLRLQTRDPKVRAGWLAKSGNSTEDQLDKLVDSVQ